MARLLLNYAPMRSRLALVILGLVVTTRVSALEARAAPVDPCAATDFSARFGPARNQYDTDWCGSVVAADVLSYRLGVRVSAISVGVNYYAGRSRVEARTLDTLLGIPAGEYGGALVSTALDLSLRATVCPEAELPDDRLELVKWDVFDRVRAVREGRAAPPTCAHPLDLSWLRWRTVGHDWWPRPSLRALHDQVRARNPVVAMVEMNQLFGLGDQPTAGARIFGNHFVLVVGQKRIGGACHVLVRNSWGSRCAPYVAPGIRECAGGQMWIEEDHFRAALKNILYLR